MKRRLDSLEGTQGAPRYPRRDSGGERSPLLPLEAKPDSPGADEHSEKAMATHSSVLAWRIPGTGSLVGYCLWSRTESDTTEAT